jgi:hypothetical protein
MKIAELFKSIENEGSSIIKDQIIKEHIDEFKSLLNNIFEDCYGSHKYFIKKSPLINQYGTLTIDINYDIFSLALKDLTNRVITGNDAIEYITKIIEQFTIDDQEWLIRILMKDLKIGYSKRSF